MKSNTLTIQVLRAVGFCRSCLLLLAMAAIVGWGATAQAAPQVDTWVGGAVAGTNLWSITNNWTVGGNPAVGVTTNGDDLIFGASGTLNPNNNFTNGLNLAFTTTNLNINSITISASGYGISGGAIFLTNGISDSSGSNTISIPVTLGASQTFQNTAGGASNTQTTASGTVSTGTNYLTIGGNGGFFFAGAISSTNGGTLTVSSAGTIARLGTANSTLNGFGTNTIQITNVLNISSYTTNTTIYTNAYIVDGVSTNYTYVTNNIISTNGTWAYTTNILGPLNVYAVNVQNGILQIGNGASIPSGAGVGSVLLNGTMDLNGQNPTVNGLYGSGIVDNADTLAPAANAVYTLTAGAGNSNGVFNGSINNTFGTVGLTKTGSGTLTLGGGNAYSGATTINQGTLVISSPNGQISPSSQTLTISSGAILDVSQWNPDGYQAGNAINVQAGTPTKPYTNYLGSFDPFNTNYTVSISGSNTLVTVQTNTDLATYTNIVRMTNVVALIYSTNSIVNIMTNDVVGSFNVTGNGQITPSTPVAPGIATWGIQGNLIIDQQNNTIQPNRANFLLNTNTTPGGGTNAYITVTGQLRIGDNFNIVIIPLYGSLASGTYTLFSASGGYFNSTPGQAIGNANLVAIAPRGISASITSDANNIYLQASGSVSPGTVKWAATSAAMNNWDIALTQNWKSNNVADYFYSQDNAVFDDTGFGTINLPTVVNMSSMTFNNNATNYTFVATPNQFITGTGGLTKNGNGSVTLNNPNSFAGDTTINGGTLILGSYGGGNQVMLYNGVAPANLVFSGAGTYSQDQGIADTQRRITFAGLVLNPGGNGTIQQLRPRASNVTDWMHIGANIQRSVGSSCYIPDGTLGRAGSISGVYFTNTIPWTNGLMGSGWLHCGTDWYLASTNFNANLAGQAFVNYYVGAPATWVANSNISVNATTASVTTSPAINTLRMVGPATVTISAGQILTNQTGGVLMSSASTGPAVITGGTIMGAAGADLIVLPNNTLNSLTIGSVIADNGSATALTLGGLGGTLILTNNNTYTGNTYINAGTMQVGAGAALGSIATTSAILDNGNLAFNRPDATSVPAVSGTGNLTQAGTGTLTLTADNSLSGQIIISAGTLQLGNGGAAGSISNTVGVADSGTLAVNNSSTVGYAGVISGVGVLVQQGPGTLILKTNETYSGLTAVTGGTLVLPSGSSISNTVAIVVGSGALLDASANGLTLRSAVPAEILAGSGSITGNVATASGTILTPGTNGVIGTLTLNNNLNLNGGSYFFDVGTNASDKILVGGTLAQTAGLVQVNPTTSLTNGVYNLISATGGLSGSPASLAVYVPGLPSGKLAVLTNATGQSLDLLVYSGIAPAITWVGDGVNNFWNSSVNSIWKDGLNNPIQYANQDFVTFDDTGSTNLPADLNVSSVFPNTITVNSTNHNYTIGSGGSDSANIIGGGASLVKNGPGTLTLQSVNSYVAGTAINGGTIKLNGAGTSASADGMLGAGPVTNNGVLIANNFTNETIAGDITGSGNLIQAGRGTLVLAGNNSGYSGAVTVASNSLQVGNGASGTLGTGNVTNNGTLLFNLNTPQSVTVPGNISGSGSITNLGSGTVILSGINSYAGNTTIPAGTLKVGSVGAIPGTTTIVLDDGTAAAGSLDLNGNDISIANLSGTNTGAGTATFRASQILNNGSGTNTITISGVVTNNFYGQIIDNNNAGSGRVKLAFLNGANYTLSAAANSAGAAGISNSTFSGGVIISNATLSLGISIGNATIGNNAGGNSGSWNGGTGPYLMTGTNAVLNTWGSGGNGGPTLITTLSTLTVPAGQSATVVGPLRGTFTCTLLGAGRLTYLVPNLQRDIIAGDWSAFTGVVIFGAVTAGQVISYTDNNGLPNAGVYFRTNASAVVFFSGRTTGNVFRMGALDGGDDTSALSGVTSANGNGGLSPIYAIGGLNSNSIFGGRVVDVNVGLRKVGTGTLTLTNNNLNFSGQCVVSNGTLAFAPLGNNPGAFNPLTNNYLVCSNFTVVDPGILDVSQAGGTIYLGHNVAAGQSLFGSGTINGNLTTMTGTNTLIAPAWGVTGRPPTPGKLKITGTATNNFPCTLNMYVSRTNGPTGGLTNDSIVANIATTPTVPTINSTRLNVFINGDTNYPPASSNVFRFFIGSVPVGSGSGITNITVPVLPAGMFWVTNLTLDGSMAIVNTNPVPVFAFTNTPGVTNFSFAGLNVQLKGTNGQSGLPYYLRVSTNAALTFSNWTTVATNTFATVGGFTFIGTNVVDTNAPQQFYILSNTNK